MAEGFQAAPSCGSGADPALRAIARGALALISPHFARRTARRARMQARTGGQAG